MIIDTKALRELAQKATPGPWTQWKGHGWVAAGTPKENTKGWMRGSGGQICDTETGEFSDAQGKRNAAYIAAANPAAVQALLDECETLRVEKAHVTTTLESTSKLLNNAIDLVEKKNSQLVRLRKIEAAAQNLAKVKGRHHSEQAMNQLLEALK